MAVWHPKAFFIGAVGLYSCGGHAVHEVASCLRVALIDFATVSGYVVNVLHALWDRPEHIYCQRDCHLCSTVVNS